MSDRNLLRSGHSTYHLGITIRTVFAQQYNNCLGYTLEKDTRNFNGFSTPYYEYISLTV